MKRVANHGTPPRFPRISARHRAFPCALCKSKAEGASRASVFQPAQTEPLWQTTFVSSSASFFVICKSQVQNAMASPSPRILIRSTRCLRVRHPRPLLLSAKRHASTKHPTNFIPPSQSDLDELRESVREFTRREIPEDLAARTDKENDFPNDMWKKFGDAGFLGITADEEFGGLAMGYQAHCVVMEEISRASGT